MPSLLDYYRPQPRPDPFGAFNSRVTYYAPGPGDRMEGGFETSKPNPQTGKRVPSTLDDVRLGTSPFVTLAGDPSRYGQTVKMGPLTYTSPLDQKSYTLPDVTGYVHDTGSAFKGRPDKLDVAAGDYRGYSPQAASAAVTADAGRRTVTPLEGDEADRAMRPIGMPEPWRATGEGYDQTAVAEGPPSPQQGQKKMPNSLMDMFQPQDAAGQPTDLGGALTGRSQSLIGLGLGLLSPSNPLRGESSWSNALQGYMGGAGLDARQATSKAALAHQKMQDAFQRSQAAQSQSNWERQFARGAEQPSITWQEDEYGNKVPYRQDPRTGTISRMPVEGTAPATAIGGAAPADTIPAAPPGSDRKEWRKEQTKLRVQQQTAEEARKKQAGMIDPVTEDIDRALAETKQYPGMIAGGFGNLMKAIPGSRAHDVGKLIDTVKANASFDKLQQMRSQSPTGASGLGAVTQGEHKLLQDSIGALDQSQTPDQFLRNLERVKRIRHEIIHGPGTAPPPEFDTSQRPQGGGTPPPPKPGFVKGGYVFKGGDPADESNWAPVRK